MRELDSLAEPALVPMFRGEPITFDRSWKPPIAIWAVKTAFVALQAHTPRLPFSDLPCHAFYASRFPPFGTYVWLCACQQEPCVTTRGNVLNLKRSDEAYDRPYAYVFTATFGCMALQVALFGLGGAGFPPYVPPQVHEQRADLLDVWPQIFADATWPPGTGPPFTEADIADLAGRFGSEAG